MLSEYDGRTMMDNGLVITRYPLGGRASLRIMTHRGFTKVLGASAGIEDAGDLTYQSDRNGT